jgi:hypothetical protein
MKTSCRYRGKYAIIVLLGLISASLVLAGAWFIPAQRVEAKITSGMVVPGEDNLPLDKDHPRVRATIEVQERHHHALMAFPHVVGTAVSLIKDQRPAVTVFTRKPAPVGLIPDQLDGMPVVEVVTGDIVAMPARAAAVNPAGKFTLPVPIGVSTGNEKECSAGTISARVKDANNVYALSNNHVYALENKGTKNVDRVLQPGLYDTQPQCVLTSTNANVIGTLSNFVPINFTSGSSNTVDAAIAVSSTGQLGNATPSNGYGMPNHITQSASIYQSVKKYGRTTGLTTGTVTAINATINVGYSSGTATFVNQIVVTSFRAFIKAGDSGSLLVTNNSAANPVGLVFAGNNSGTYAVANPIDAVLGSFRVTIDGK